MPKTILVTGANGQVGREFQRLAQGATEEEMHFYFTDKESLDITDKQAIASFVEKNPIDVIVNCAAYTAVDKAETEKALADKINHQAVAHLAQIAKEKQIQLVHISTDYVFDGTAHRPLHEQDKTNPQGIYAKSKHAGEEAILQCNPKGSIIIRTSWVYNHDSHNFLNTMLKLGKERESIHVVSDQIGTPTYARDLASDIMKILKKEADFTRDTQIYHYSNEGSCSWYDFAQAIFELTDMDCKVVPIATEAYPTPAKRPAYSVLNKDKIKKEYGLDIPYWRDALKACLEQIDVENTKQYKIGIVGSGFIANGLAKLLLDHPQYRLSKVLTRTDITKRNDFIENDVLTNSLDVLIESSDLIVECTGDAIYATDTIDAIVKANIPVVTMNSEFHVTTGSYFVDKGLVTEAEGDQPGVQAILHEEAVSMGFRPLAYMNIKGFLNENPSKEDMEYWGKKQNISTEMVTSFTDGTKVSIEQVLVANGLGAGLVQEGLVKLENDDMLEGGTFFANKAKNLGFPVSDYLLSSKLPAGVFLIAEHNDEQVDALRYYKLGEGPYYVLERTYHLCHLEIIKTIKRVLDGGGVLLDNSAQPRFSVAAVAKHALHAGDEIAKGIGSFDVRGIAIEINKHQNHVPIGLLTDAKLTKDIKEGEMITFDDITLQESLALNIWKEIVAKV